MTEQKSSLTGFQSLVRVGLSAFQFGLLILLIRMFEVEGKGFLHLVILAFGGFVVHHFLPARTRLPLA